MSNGNRFYLLAARDPLEFWLGKSIGNIYLRLALFSNSSEGVLIYPFPLNGKQWIMVKEQEIKTSPDYYAILSTTLLDSDVFSRLIKVLQEHPTTPLKVNQWLKNFFLGHKLSILTSYQLLNMALNVKTEQVDLCLQQNSPRKISEPDLPFALSLYDLAEEFRILRKEYYQAETPMEVRNFLQELTPAQNQLYIRKMFSCTAKYRDLSQLQVEFYNSLQSGCMDISTLPSQEKYSRTIFLSNDRQNHLANHVRKILTDWDSWLRDIENKVDVLIFPLTKHTEKLNKLNELVFGKHRAYQMQAPQIEQPTRVFLDQNRNQHILYHSLILQEENLQTLNDMNSVVLLEILDVIDQKGVNNTFINRVREKINQILAARHHVNNLVGN